MPLRLAFMGSPDFATPTLEAILAAGHDVACVYSQPPRPAGRGQAMRKTPVHRLAEARGLEARTPLNFRSEADRAAFAALDLDVAVVVAYGLILPRAILDAPRQGCFNLHGSLLPRWRGAAPIHRAIMAGDNETGVQVMRMEAGLDTGPVMLTARTPIREGDTMQDVHDRLSRLGAGIMVEALALIEAGRVELTPQIKAGQDEAAVTYAAKVTAEEGRIDWSRPAEAVSAHIRGLSPSPGAWFEIESNAGVGGAAVRAKALNAQVEAGSGVPGDVLDEALLVACGTGAVRLTRLQRAGRGPMDAATFLRGTPVARGRKLL